MHQHRFSLIVCLLAVLLIRPVKTSASNLVQSKDRGRNQVKKAPVSLLQPIHKYNNTFEELFEKTDTGAVIDKNPYRYFNDMSGDYGRMGPEEKKIKHNPQGFIDVGPIFDWTGEWNSVAGLAEEKHKTLNFNKCYPGFINGLYQPKCIGVYLRVKGNGVLKLECKSARDIVMWVNTFKVASVGFQEIRLSVPTKMLTNVKFLNWIVERGTVSIDDLSLVLQFPELPIETMTFLKSYVKLARCYDPIAGVVKDRENWPVGDFDSVPTSGLFCLATCAAADLGIVNHAFAHEVLRKVHGTIRQVPTMFGVLPHFLRRYDGKYRIHKGTEYSTVDHALYAFSMMLAATCLGEKEILREVTADVCNIDFKQLYDERGRISHGFNEKGLQLKSYWFDWGAETALVLLLESVVMGKDAKLAMSSSGKVHNEVGFIPLLCDLFTRRFDQSVPDAITKQNWNKIKRELLRKQMHYFKNSLPDSRASLREIYGLSAGEGPNGLGYVANGTALPGIQLIHPHYILLSSMFHPSTREAYRVISRLEEEELFPPWGLVENCNTTLKNTLPMNGSLNASFEVISAYHLHQKHLNQPDIIYEAAESCKVFAEALNVFYPAKR